VLQVDEKYLKELGFDDLSGKEKDNRIANVQGAILEKVIEKITPKVPDIDKVFEEAKQEFKKEILEFRSSSLDDAILINPQSQTS
jgi:hypothetical protein